MSSSYFTLLPPRVKSLMFILFHSSTNMKQHQKKWLELVGIRGTCVSLGLCGFFDKQENVTLWWTLGAALGFPSVPLPVFRFPVVKLGSCLTLTLFVFFLLEQNLVVLGPMFPSNNRRPWRQKGSGGELNLHNLCLYRFISDITQLQNKNRLIFTTDLHTKRN